MRYHHFTIAERESILIYLESVSTGKLLMKHSMAKVYT